jgi:hypothetical protein
MNPRDREQPASSKFKEVKTHRYPNGSTAKMYQHRETGLYHAEGMGTSTILSQGHASSEEAGNHHREVARSWVNNLGKIKKNLDGMRQDPFEVVGHLRNDEHGEQAPMYRHRQTGLYHYENPEGNGPSAQGHPTIEHAALRHHQDTSGYLQAEFDEDADSAERYARSFRFHPLT